MARSASILEIYIRRLSSANRLDGAMIVRSYPWILVCAGMNLILAQYWTMREYLFVLKNSEVTILLVVGAFFASCSLGYLLALRRIQPLLRRLCVLLCLVQFTFPWLFKELAALIEVLELPHYTTLLLGFGILVMAPLYTILLPHLIEKQEEQSSPGSGDAVAICYGLELGGALLGVGVILTLGRVSFAALVVLYFLNLSAIIAFIYSSKKLLLVAALVSLCYGFFYPSLDRAGAEDFYHACCYSSCTRLIASAQSIYNRVDVL